MTTREEQMIESYGRCVAELIQAQRRAYEAGRFTFEEMRKANRAIWKGAEEMDPRITDRAVQLIGEYRCTRAEAIK